MIFSALPVKFQDNIFKYAMITFFQNLIYHLLSSPYPILHYFIFALETALLNNLDKSVFFSFPHVLSFTDVSFTKMYMYFLFPPRRHHAH